MRRNEKEEGDGKIRGRGRGGGKSIVRLSFTT